jgi:hypothetical protein
VVYDTSIKKLLLECLVLLLMVSDVHNFLPLLLCEGFERNLFT